MPHRLDELLIALSTAALLSLTSWLVPSSKFQLVLLVFAFLYTTFNLGITIAPKSHLVKAGILGGLATASTLSLLLTISYYLNIPSTAAIDGYALAITMVLWQIYFIRKPHPTVYQDEAPKAWTQPLILSCIGAAILLFLIFLVQALVQSGTTESIRTPWPLVPEGFIPALASLGLAGLGVALIQKQGRYAALTIATSVIVLASLAPSIYRLGYGFDGFIHRASEQVLSQTGTLTPKPPYYIGIYVWNIWVQRLSGISLRTIDIWMNIALLGMVPFALYWASKRSGAFLAVTGLIALAPLTAFIGSTPQTTAYILGFIGLGLVIGKSEHDDVGITGLLVAIWATAVHPLAGLPFLLIAVASFLLDSKLPKIGRVILSVLFLIASLLAVPTAFYVNSLHSQANIQWNPAVILNGNTYLQGLSSIFTPPTTHVALLADGASAIEFFTPWLVLLFAIIAIIKDSERRKTWLLLTLGGLGLLIVSLLLKASGEFTFLIDYERGNYADRLILIGWLIWTIPACIGFHAFMARAWRSQPVFIGLVCLLFVGWQSGQIYLAYPRHDAAVVGRGWSVGQTDFEAVRFINQDAGNEPYTVLANQSVSAAAMELYGFKRYAGDVFYYPIPTGGPLYSVFLEAVGDDPNKDLIQEAATLGQSQRVYVVLNNYWWNADVVKEKLSAISDKSQSFGNDQVIVFRFDVSNASNASK